MRPRSLMAVALGSMLLAAVPMASVDARTVYRCVRHGSVSLATAPEPGSRCIAKVLDDDAVIAPNLWGNMGVVSGTLYQREQDGKTVYGTRMLPGAIPVLQFTVKTPPGSPAHVGLGRLGAPQLARYPQEFKAAARATGIDEAWLRAIAHAESGFDPHALSPKGAQGVMQLMPALARAYGVRDPYAPEQSIGGGARYLQSLLHRYRNDIVRAVAAYNAGVTAVARYDGIPPYAETQTYVAKVQSLHERYRAALERDRHAH